MRLPGVFPGGGPHPSKGEGRRGSGGLQEEGGVVWDLSVRQLPQHTNEEEFVRGGSVVAKLSVQHVDVHGHRIAPRAVPDQGAGWRPMVRFSPY
jgi:hypothetical protein